MKKKSSEANSTLINYIQSYFKLDNYYSGELKRPM